MKHWFLKYWWAFPISLAALMFILTLLFSTVPTVFEDIVCVLLALTFIGLVVSWVFLLINKQRRNFFTSLSFSCLIVLLFGFLLAMVSLSSPDGFGRIHKIPEGMVYNLPLGYTNENNHKDAFGYSDNTPDVAEIDSLNPDTYLQIWNDFQGGMYKYSFYYGPLPQGEIFLRCYEVTKNVRLSEYEIAERSNVKIDTTHTFRQLVYKKGFTIYEGDWENYYAARIEVWHKNASTGEETKLLEKIYRVEGWMR